MEEIGKRRMGEEKRDAFYSLFYSQKNIHFSSFPSHFPSLAIKKHQIYSLHAHYFTAWLRKLRHEMEGESSSHRFKAATASKVSHLHLKGQDLPAVWSSTEQTQYLFNKGKTAVRLHGNLCCLNPSSLA